MAGLDPLGQKLILALLKKRQAKGETTVLISHDLKQLIPLVDRIAILDQGTLVHYGDVNSLLDNSPVLAQYCSELPDYLQVRQALADHGFKGSSSINNLIEAGQEIARLLA